MPGMETAAPERTETKSGASRSPKRRSITFSSRARCSSTSSTTSSGSFPPASWKRAQTVVAIVNPGGTGSPRRDISARLAPLPPSSSFREASPSVPSGPKK